jgi:hypothetical protein
MESSKLSAASVSSSPNRRSIRIVRACSLTAFLVLAIASYSLWRQFQSTRPTFSDQNSGQIHALNAGHWTVYVTRTDQIRLFGLAAAAAACLAGAVALDTFFLGRDEDD